ncbi:MAG: hypothetical protein UX04_C0002G0229 [Microgenomates group bacterium GW2011_GWF2_45_18]|nr:MAG: hypothetical protein UW18_C0003G0333 [Microgenomates group bacterium GW2011_GWF1_44_10]KKU02086.1 MAG: hypothetical protein UX04_C0002G0229 [Microgenomates group bacterium GW2011_GWF2_45_18]HAU98639.1 hypothetical protein [Candidatus Paceibacterota bacterium]HAX01490.1 hypothetical protein [Candidatus Paceibacterota bacterium]
MTPKESRPGSDYYENPYIPSAEERADWRTLPLRPVEAHYLLVNNVGNMSQADAAALRAIADDDDNPDQEVDLFSTRRNLGFDNED